MNKPRKTNYTDIEFRDMIRGVSDSSQRVYFSDVDFVEYVYKNNTREYVCILEAKRKYQIGKGEYRLVDSDKAVIGLANRLGIPFLFVFYKEGRLKDQEDVLLVWVEEEVELLSVSGALQEGKAVNLSVGKLKEFLRCVGSRPFKDCWRELQGSFLR
ncbi:MAG: hypothetical protein NZ526_07290 [Aquificaceae bacterium]|nr:hypothetical protein [Aquificaceae bacterium]